MWRGVSAALRRFWSDQSGAAMVAGPSPRSSANRSTFVQASVPIDTIPKSAGQLNFTGNIGTGQNPTRGLVSWGELQVPFIETRGRASWAELEIPLVPTRGRASWSELELPLVPTRGLVSWSELQVAFVETRGRASWGELEVPTAPGTPTRGRVASCEFEVYDLADCMAYMSARVRGQFHFASDEYRHVSTDADGTWRYRKTGAWLDTESDREEKHP